MAFSDWRYVFTLCRTIVWQKSCGNVRSGDNLPSIEYDENRPLLLKISLKAGYEELGDLPYLISSSKNSS